METVLGLLGMLVYIAAVILLASGVTWLVVKLSPSQSAKELEAKSSAAGGS
jgi:hypothetical protein